MQLNSITAAKRYLHAWLTQESAIPVVHFERVLDQCVSRFIQERHEAKWQPLLHFLAEHMQTKYPEPYVLELLQAVICTATRKSQGMYFTPQVVAEYLVRWGLAQFPQGKIQLLDPACGGGVFLIAAQQLAGKRERTLVGCDVSSAAVHMSQALVGEAKVQHANPLLDGEQCMFDLVQPHVPLLLVGNPPYSNFGKAQVSPWLQQQLQDYRGVTAERKINVSDSSLKFLRWAQAAIARAGSGVVAFVMNRTLLDGLTQVGVRNSLSCNFDHIEIIDLHGDGAANDDNIFGIRRGVCLLLLAKHSSQPSPQILYTSVLGTRQHKLNVLREASLTFTPVPLDPPQWRFVPPVFQHASTTAYEQWPRLVEIFDQYISGVQTKRDALFVDLDREVLSQRLQTALEDPSHVQWVTPPKPGDCFEESRLVRYLVAPGDVRWLYYDETLLGRARKQVTQHLLPRPVAGNTSQPLGLIFMRQAVGTGVYDHAFVTDCPVSDRVFYSRRGAPFVAPLWFQKGSESIANLQQPWLDQFATRLGTVPNARAILAYLYAVLHVPQYRRQYAAQLAVDFPRIPWPDTLFRFQQFEAVGKQLLEFHVSDPLKPTPVSVRLYGEGVIARGYPRWQGDQWLINREAHLSGISPVASAFRIGGFAVLPRWLQARPARMLATADLQHLSWLNLLAENTLQLQAELDTLWQTWQP